jgi:oligoribonuclease NrnB/cAMP/cGMP phosphodiesterase (DHH superfamily)
MYKEEDIKLAEQMNVLFSVIKALNHERLKEFEKELKDQLGQYEAIGIIDGHSYFKKVDDMRARHDRVVSLIKLIDTFNNTQSKII